VESEKVPPATSWEQSVPSGGEDDGPGCFTMQRFRNLRNNISLTLDLQIGMEPSASSRHRGSAGETCGWRKLTLAAVPMAEGDEKPETVLPQQFNGDASSSSRRPRRSSLGGAPPAADGGTPRPRRRSSLLQVRSVTTGGRTARATASAVKIGSTKPRRTGLPMFEGDDGLMNLEAKWQRVKATCLRGEPFAEEDVRAIRHAFSRFKTSNDHEVHKKDLNEFVQYLGYIVLRAEDVLKVAEEVTPYSTLDITEAVAFVEKYARAECQKLLVLFQSYDADESGKLSTEELRRALSSFGFVPYRSMVDEAMEAVDDNGDGELDFEEFLHFLTVYRHNQGFTRQQVLRALRTFGRFTQDVPKLGKVLLKASVGPALCQLYGPRSERSANTVAVKHFGNGGGRRAAQAQQLAGREYTKEDVIEFPDFLVFARLVRELEQYSLMSEFRRCDRNGDGVIDVEELGYMLANMGFEPLTKPITDIMEESSKRYVDDELVLDQFEFFNFMELFWEREGFSRSELAELDEAFSKFDEDESGTIDTAELGSLFAGLGHRVSSSELTALVVEFDGNRSGSLDDFEFLRLMRQHRNGQIRQLKGLFQQYADNLSKGSKAAMKLDETHAAVAAVLGSPSKLVIDMIDQKMSEAKKKAAARAEAKGRRPSLRRTSLTDGQAGALSRRLETTEPVGIVFNDFVEIVDYGRSQRLTAAVSHAGFSEQELTDLRSRFVKYDEHPDGTLDHTEIRALLDDLDVQWLTREDQLAVLADFEKARSASRKAGMPSVGGANELRLGYWDFVQLMRLLLDRRERDMEERTERTAKELHFSWSEVKQFRDIFEEWSRREREAILAANGGNSKGDDSDITNITRTAGGISPSTFVRVVRSLGVSASLRQMQELEAQVAKHPDKNRQGQLMFVGFLAMMRWIMDTDFAGINEAAEKRVLNNHLATHG
jgi:Ca2+-binding EF-hand superfamily protein